MPVRFIIASSWSWFLETGINLAIILVIALFIPRIGRFAKSVVRRRLDGSIDTQGSKNQLAFAGVGIYVVQIIAYFVLIVVFLQQVGFSLAGAAIPATVVSAAIGFGAQSIIADFLAGFFILMEKQFGVGDWVRFEGNGIEVEGTVTEITMRATRIRTIAQETVIIPNSTAKVCINNSNNWSRAVVVMPVPMLGSDNIAEVILRSESAARRALNQDDIAAEILGELDVHPAIDVQPPTVVGMPWLVSMRFLIQVTAGNQWMVERAIRTQIIDEFWSEYGSATTTSGAFVDTLTLDEKPQSSTPTHIDTGAGSARIDTQQKLKPPLVDETPSTQELSPGNPESSETASPTDDVVVDDADTKEEADQLPGLFRTDSYDKSWQKILSFGGRIRMSSTALLISLGALLILKGFSIDTGEDWDGNSGWLAPAPAAETSTTEESIPVDTVAPSESVITSSPEPALPSSDTTTEESATPLTPTSQAPERAPQGAESAGLTEQTTSTSSLAPSATPTQRSAITTTP